ncbi:transmembrane protein 41B-like [Tigriopus californicus]|uniref:transmembrane protein 41B-like n=1 Tax=Tigriopus californicus TaxID=6832 RepID=UPI0027DA47AE|nr:transmembrane protein 41B-like [Tigriopus californicus]
MEVHADSEVLPAQDSRSDVQDDDEEEQEEEEEDVLQVYETKGYLLRTKTALTLLAVIFFGSFASLIAIYMTYPSFTEEESQYLQFPTDFDKAKKLGLVLSNYKDKYYYQVLGGVILTYTFVMSFGIPGGMLMSLVSGFLFSFPLALLLSCCCCTVGATLCYLLGYLLGRNLLLRFMPHRLAQWSKAVQNHRHNLFFYILFLRITPIVPNWFVNVTSSVIGVPLYMLSVGTFIGVVPPCCVWIQAGTTLQHLSTASEVISLEAVGVIVVLALMSVVPVLIRERNKIANFCQTCPSRLKSSRCGKCCGRSNAITEEQEVVVEETKPTIIITSD